jgi:diguanylate cyclase (GGDEF)-like protein
MTTVNRVQDILKSSSLTAVFQPIVCLSRRSILGYEGLIRGPKGSPLNRPDKLFAQAESEHCTLELDFLCREVIVREFAVHRLPGRLFINIHPASLADRNLINGHLLGCVESQGLEPGHVVIEITETYPIHDFDLFHEALVHYRGQGFKFAIDDLGAGYSGLKVWSESNPDFVKVDRHFVQDVDSDKTKQRFISAILEISKAMGCETIAEGVETKNEYATLRRLGVNTAQGYYFALPGDLPARNLDESLFSERMTRSHALAHHQLTAACLVRNCPTISPEENIDKLAELFQDNPLAHSLPVVKFGEPYGLVVRDDFMSLMASRYGRDLNHRKRVRQFIQKRSLIVEKDEALESISRRLTTAVNHYAEEFIIADNGEYLGIGHVMDLLGKITELQVTKARYANPLTLLPGNVVIQQVLQEAIGRFDEFAVAYLDIDNFKAFNDAYGYAHGDEVIRLLGRLLQECTDAEKDFVGHIGGDDFIALIWGESWKDRCERVVETFGSLVEAHYSPQDRSQGGITATDRFGIPRHFPVMTLSVGVLWVRAAHQELSPERIAELATAAKSKAKQRVGNHIAIEVFDLDHTYDLWTPQCA